MDRRTLLIGLLLGLLFGPAAFLLPHELRIPYLGGLLWLTVGIYLGMAFMDSPRQSRTQILGGIPVVVLVMLGLLWPWLLVVAWALHPAWDILHHLGLVRTKIHPATVPFCITFDLALAASTAAVILFG